jgi:hypothetical protein
MTRPPALTLRSTLRTGASASMTSMSSSWLRPPATRSAWPGRRRPGRPTRPRIIAQPVVALHDAYPLVAPLRPAELAMAGAG